MLIITEIRSGCFCECLYTSSGHVVLKRHSQLLDRADLDISFLNLKKSSPQPEIKVHLEYRFNLASILLDFQSFLKNLFLSVFLLIL